MSQTIETKRPVVPPEEVARRIAEYRQLAYQNRSPAVMVYRPEYQSCPWSDCDFKISGIDFQLDKWTDSALREQMMKAWWLGSGFVGRCPSCRRYVLYGYQEKRAVADPALHPDGLLPDDWPQKVHGIPPLERAF